MYLARISHKVTSKPERGTKTKKIDVCNTRSEMKAI